MSAPVIARLTDHAVAAGLPRIDEGGAGPRLRPIPVHEPPLSDHPAALRLVSAGSPQLALPLRIPTAEPDQDPVFGPQQTDRQDLPEPEPWARRFFQATLESLAGRRSPAQLQYWTSWDVYRDIVQAAQRPARDRPSVQPRVHRGENVYIGRIRVCEPADGIAEVCAVARRDGRWKAVAARLEGLDGRWRCTSLTLG